MAKHEKNTWTQVAQLARNGARTTAELASADKLDRFARFVARLQDQDRRNVARNGQRSASLRD